jgi:hypothetical protein
MVVTITKTEEVRTMEDHSNLEDMEKVSILKMTHKKSNYFQLIYFSEIIMKLRS